MARRKILALLIFILLSASGSAMSFSIDIDALTQHTVKGVEYRENVSTVQEINATVENPGSVGCYYRLRAQTERNNETYRHYSSSKPVWPGSSEFLELKYAPLNTTGVENVELKLEYCGNTVNVTNFEYNNTDRTLVNRTVQAEIKQVSEEKASIHTEGSGTLVPHQAPPYWKVPSAELYEGKAEIDYEPTIFREGEKIEYIAFSNGEPEKIVQVELTSPKPTMLDRIEQNRFQILISVLLISLTGNLILIHEKNTETEKL